MTPSLPSKPSLLIGVVFLLLLVFAVEYFLGWKVILRTWHNLNPGQAIAAVALVMLSYGVRTLRLVFFFPTELGHAFTLSLKLMLAHNFWNNFLPMRTGELSFPILMSRYFDLPAVRSLPALFWFRLLDLYVVLMLVVATLMMVNGDRWLALVSMLLLTAMVPLVWVALPALLTTVGKAEATPIARFCIRLGQALPRDWQVLLTSSFWTLLNWLVKLITFSWVIIQFVPIKPDYALLGTIGGELTSILPIHGVAGAGTYEAGVVAAMIPLGVDPKDALMAAVNLHIFLLSCSLIGGLISYFIPTKIVLPDTASHQDESKGKG